MSRLHTTNVASLLSNPLEMHKTTSLYTTALVLVFAFLCACDNHSEFSKKYPVNFTYMVTASQQLFGTMGNYGQFCSIRRETNNGKTEIVMTNSSGTGRYTIDATQKYFNYGLGGLIVGTNIYGEHLAYDLACPSCDRNTRRLTLRDNGFAICNHCGLTYDMNNHGVISSRDSTARPQPDARGMLRYHITYNGTHITVYN